MAVGEHFQREWPTPGRVYLTVDYECDYGTALRENSFGALSATGRLVDLLEDLEVPLTCFIQTQVLEERPEEVARLQDADVPVSFHPHSHTHQRRARTDVSREVARSTAAYLDYFGEAPTGYRFPNGNVRMADYAALSNRGYEFDASVFPSWRPGYFDNRSGPTTPVYLPVADLFEIPFTVYSDRFKVPTVLSYCRLLGRPFLELLARRPPEVVVFNIHMHDLVNPPAFERLSPFYKVVYSRNPVGFGLLREVLERLRDAGRSFGRLDEVAAELAQRDGARLRPSDR